MPALKPLRGRGRAVALAIWLAAMPLGAQTVAPSRDRPWASNLVIPQCRAFAMTGRDTVLIGDAAHAMMPFSAQGAAMAIEDAYSLAMHTAKAPLPSALAAFSSERKVRAARVKARGDFNRFAYHARGPFRMGRDIVLSLRPPERLAADLDWLYGHRIDG